MKKLFLFLVFFLVVMTGNAFSEIDRYGNRDIRADKIATAYNMPDSTYYDVISNGQINDAWTASLSDAYDGAFYLYVNNNMLSGTTDTTEDNGREIVSTQVTNTLTIVRKIYIPSVSGQAPRILDMITNTGTTAQNVDVLLWTNLGSDGYESILNTSSGNTTAELTDNWVITDDNAYNTDGTGDPALGFVFQNSGATETLDSLKVGEGNVFFGWRNVSIAAGATAGFVYFPLLANTQTLIQNKVNSVMNGTYNLTAGMSAAEIACVRNWSFTGQTVETVSAPTSISGSTSVSTGSSISYTASGSSSSYGHTVQYRLDWGDGTFSDWSTSFTKTWSTAGTYSLKAQARCASDNTIVSAWSGTLKTITVTAPGATASNVTAAPSPTNGASTITVNARISTGSTGKIAAFENVEYSEKIITDSKDGSIAKPAKVSTVNVGNTNIKASVADNGEIIILTASDQRLLYSSTYTGKTFIRIDGLSYLFGGTDGVWTSPLAVSGNQVTGVWTKGDVAVTATISIVQSTTTGNYDTFLMQYDLNNNGSTSHDVGFYKMFDTMLNGNDSAPVSAGDGLNLNEREFVGANVPNYWQAYEVGPTQDSTKLTAQGTLYGGGAVKPDRFVIGYWQNLKNVTWDYTTSGTYSDSAVSLWWNPTTLSPGSGRTVATLYGLGSVTTVSGQLSLTLSGESALSVIDSHVNPNPFQITAIVTNSTSTTVSNVVATLTLPSGLTLASGETATQSIGSLTSGSSGQRTWSVIATEKTTDATYTCSITARSSTTGISQVSANKTVFVPGIAASSYVSAAEMYFDTDPGQGLATAMTATDGTFDEATEDVTKTASISSLSIGEHKVYVRGRDSGGSWGSTVYTTFLVTNPRVTYPTAAGVTWSPGSSYTITWSGFAGTTVDIALYKGTSLVSTIATATPNDGTQSWTLPTTTTAGNDYKIRITGSNSQSDYSDNAFTIGGMTVTVSTVAGTNGSIVDVPITVTGGDQLYSSFIGLTFSSTDLDLTSITSGTGVTTEWKRSTALTSVQITALKAAGFGSSSTTICTLKFYVKKGAGTSAITFSTTLSKFYKDDGTLLSPALVNGAVTIGTGSTIAGSRGDINIDNAVDVRDALYVLRMSVLSSVTVGGTSYTTPYNVSLKYRGDVNGNGLVQSNDATLILRKVLGINTNLYPLSSAGKMAELPTVRLVSSGAENSGITFGLSGTNLDGVASGDFVVRYDPDIMSFVSLENSPVLENMNFEYNVSEPGILRIAMAQASGFENPPSEILSLKFEIKNPSTLTNNAITIDEVCLWNENDNQVETSLRNTVISAGDNLMKEFVLYQNMPNPFNPSTAIEFNMDRDSRVVLKIYNIAGQEVASLVDEIMTAGRHSVVWDAKGMPSGMYFYKLSAGNYSETKKMMLLK